MLCLLINHNGNKIKIAFEHLLMISTSLFQTCKKFSHCHTNSVDSLIFRELLCKFSLSDIQSFNSWDVMSGVVFIYSIFHDLVLRSEGHSQNIRNLR